MRRALLASALAAALIGCGDDDGATPDGGGGGQADAGFPDAGVCEGPNGPCTVLSPGDDVQAALIEAQSGDIILFEAGTFELTVGLSLDVDGVTLRGRGMDRSILSFAGQVAGAEGLLVTGDDFVIEDLGMEDTDGDVLKMEGITGVTVQRVRTEWTNGPDSENGGYGIYPVQCKNVLIQDSVAIGASDTGIYVGQSQDIIVRRNRPEFNVAGIEIENSLRADVYENVSTNNTAGILVFTLPGLQEPVARGIRIFDNEVFANNTQNFAPAGAILSNIPTGTGFATIAAKEVEVFGNEFRDNQTANLAVVSFLLADIEYDDPDYDPYPDTFYAHDNTFSGGGNMPSDGMGFLIVQALQTVMELPIVVPDLLWDGFVDPAVADAGGALPADRAICFQNNGDADFANLDAQHDFAMVSLDAAPHDCAHPPVPAVTIPGVE